MEVMNKQRKQRLFEMLEGRQMLSALPIGDTTPPSIPFGIAGAPVGSRQLDLSWNEAFDPESGIQSYSVYRDGTLVGTSIDAAFSDASFSPGDTLTYQVLATNGASIDCQ